MFEPLIYVATMMLAVSAGLMAGARIASPHRWTGGIAAVLIVGGVLIGGVVLGSAAPWVGPIFGIVSGITVVLVSATARRDEPAFRSEPFGRRVLMVLSRQYRPAGSPPNPTNQTEPAADRSIS